MQIVVVAPPIAEYAFEPVEAELKRRGHNVTRYREIAAFVRKPDALATADILYGSGFSVNDALLARAPQLRAVVTPWIGIEGFDLAAATVRDIVIANGQVPENYLSMAEATIMLMLAALHNFPERSAALRENRPPPPRREARMLRGKTVGLIGFGNMARAIAERLGPWEVELLTYAPRIKGTLPANVVRIALDDLLQRSDIVCVLASLNAETRHMLDEPKLRLMKPDAILINTARGGIVDEAALGKIVAEGRLHKVALDVFETEPLPPESPLRALPRTILTPHCVGHSWEGAVSIAKTALENILAAIDGQPPRFTLNPEVLSAWQKRWHADASGG